MQHKIINKILILNLMRIVDRLSCMGLMSKKIIFILLYISHRVIIIYKKKFHYYFKRYNAYIIYYMFCIFKKFEF